MFVSYHEIIKFRVITSRADCKELYSYILECMEKAEIIVSKIYEQRFKGKPKDRYFYLFECESDEKGLKLLSELLEADDKFKYHSLTIKRYI